MSTTCATTRPHRFSWQQTMLRIKDPKRSVPFYQQNFGFSLIHEYHFPQWAFSLYFLAILPEGVSCPEPGTPESEAFLWDYDGVCLELTHNHGSELDDQFTVNNGNVEPHRGFGHIAVMTRDVVSDCIDLEANGVRFHKRPHEGRMKDIAFALDPDNYWIEIVPRAADSAVQNKFTLAQTMVRVKDAQKALAFYQDLLGMSLLREAHFSDFSLYFLAHVPVGTLPADHDATSESAAHLVNSIFEPVLELTHNHGTELDENFHYHNGNDTDQGQLRGFGHVGFLVDDLDAACAWLEAKGVQFKKRPQEGSMRGLAFAYDPDNYWVEIIQRKGLKML